MLTIQPRKPTYERLSYKKEWPKKMMLLASMTGKEGRSCLPIDFRALLQGTLTPGCAARCSGLGLGRSKIPPRCVSMLLDLDKEGMWGLYHWLRFCGRGKDIVGSPDGKALLVRFHLPQFFQGNFPLLHSFPCYPLPWLCHSLVLRIENVLFGLTKWCSITSQCL